MFYRMEILQVIIMKRLPKHSSNSLSHFNLMKENKITKKHRLCLIIFIIPIFKCVNWPFSSPFHTHPKPYFPLPHQNLPLFCAYLFPRSDIIFYRRMRKNSVPSFIQKAWRMMQNPQNEHIIRWRPNGQSFEILNEELFSTQVLPHYFKHSNFSSFIRQLNMYNFHKRKHSDGVEFYHQLFRKDQRQLLIGIRRKPSEAEILQGEELIRRLAPECVKQVIPNENKEEQMQEQQPHESLQASPVLQPQSSPMQQQNRPAFGLLGWALNGCEFNKWSVEKKVKTTVIIGCRSVSQKQNLELDLENRGF